MYFNKKQCLIGMKKNNDICISLIKGGLEEEGDLFPEAVEGLVSL